ncbi:hypothetical protein ACIBL6_04385 [Streptomyces sp. NPDC050400]|uniref:hypothetical protein n=1 Tax=Streptomyces sp. NPDC050400 TaxID=3365610 RepID=UPI0037BD65C0
MGRNVRTSGPGTWTGAVRPATATVTDRAWAHELRAALLSTALVFGLALTVDAAHSTLTPPRVLLWTGLSLPLYAVLHPPRVTAGPGWLAVRGLFRRRHVCTDLLVSARRADGLTPRLVLRDTLGARVELDPQILTANPLLWHRVETGAGRARANGLLVTGIEVLRSLGAQVDEEEAKAIFEASNLT